MDSILDAVGNTPLVRLRRLEKDAGLKCELYAKCEYLNAGGSVKDRIAVRMVEHAEQRGEIKPGDTLIEPTSGNTGVGLAMVACVKGYKCIITLPEKMSAEKVNVLKLLGAEIIRTPTDAAFDSPESHIGVARRLQKELPRAHILDQYTNEDNPKAHYYSTGAEILAQLPSVSPLIAPADHDSKAEASTSLVHMLVCGAGTGGTITGIAKRLREHNPGVVVVGADPHGSVLARPERLNDAGIQAYAVEGIGYDFVPAVLEHDVVDEWVKTSDAESFHAARRLMRVEGLLVGGSSGSALCAALATATRLGPGERCVVVLPDSCRNYMSKFVSDEWMIQKGFLKSARHLGAQEPWGNVPVAALRLAEPVTVSQSVSCKETAAIMTKACVDQLPVVHNTSGAVVGVVTEGNLSAQLLSRRVRPEDAVQSVMYKQFRTVNPCTVLSELSELFLFDHFALVTTEQNCYSDGLVMNKRTLVTGVVTHLDLLNYVIMHSSSGIA